MNRVTLALMVAGLAGFAGGAWVAALGERPLGIGLMAAGLAFQILTLFRLKQARKKQNGEAL